MGIQNSPTIKDILFLSFLLTTLNMVFQIIYKQNPDGDKITENLAAVTVPSCGVSAWQYNDDNNIGINKLNTSTPTPCCC